MANLPEGLDNILIKIIIMAVFVILAFVDRVFNYWKLHFQTKVEERRIQDVLELNRDKIMRGIGIDIKCMLLVWCPTKEFRPDFIIAVLGEFDSDVQTGIKFNDYPPFSSGQTSWIKIVATFDSEEAALMAARELASRTSYTVTFHLSQIMDIVIEAEARHPLFGQGLSRVQLHSRKRLPESDSDDRKNIEKILDVFGKVESLDFCEKDSDTPYLEAALEATYEYASQALLFKLVIDGYFFKPMLDRFTVILVQTGKERYIAWTLKNRLRDLIDGNRVVRA